MATWKAEVWESGVGHYDVEVQAPTWVTARTKICDIYCVDENEVVNLQEVNGWGSSASSAGDMGGWLIIGAILFVIWLVMEYWWIVVPIAAICGLGWIAMKTEHLWNK